MKPLARAITPPARLGVIGGGQLGRMFINAARQMGYRTVVLAATPDSPAAQVADQVVVGPPGDPTALRRFRQLVDAVTVEFENVSAPALRWLERSIPTRPGWRTVRICQNRLREKSFLTAHQIPVAPWRPVRDRAELAAALADLGLPLILKTADSGYDGKGQLRVERTDELDAAWTSLQLQPCVVESVVPFVLELSVIVARGVDGQTRCYPAAWNQHERHILDVSVAPAPIPVHVADLARTTAERIADRLEAVGVLCVEFFLTADERLLVNEIAPRPHNSGHLTIEATPTSQFAQQVRALCGLQLGPTKPTRPAAMANLLGDLWNSSEPAWEHALMCVPESSIHLYGKRTPAPGRKMGHLTLLADDVESALARVVQSRQALSRP